MTPRRPGPAAVIAALAALLSTGCVRQERFRFVPATSACLGQEPSPDAAAARPKGQKPSLDCRSALYKMAFIEFDQRGVMFDRQQWEAARRLLEFEKARVSNGRIITLVYIHGWKNNAAGAAPGGKPKDVEKFQGALLELGARAEQVARRANQPSVPVVGIYLAWRGKTLMGPDWVTFASLWSRRNTANNIGDGPDLGPVIERILDLTNHGNEQSRVLLIGHSFGARVLEHAIESKQIRLYETAASGAVRPRADLVLYVNSANDSRLSMTRVQALKAAGLRVRHPDFDAAKCGLPLFFVQPDKREALADSCRDYPLIVAITSKGDAATKYLLPIANTINGDRLTRELADRLPPLPTGGGFADRTPSGGTVRRVAAGHFGFLQSHVTRAVACPTVRRPAPADEATTVQAMIDDAVRRAVATALGTGEVDEARRAREAAERDRRRREEAQRLERARHPVCSPGDRNCRFVFRTLGATPTCYQVDARPSTPDARPFNDTAFWIMDVEPTVIKDHGDIWNVSFVEMLGQLMAPMGFFDPASPPMQMRAAPPK